MADSSSPLMLRRRLRTELRTARLVTNLTQEQVAKAMEWSMSKVNRIEQAKTGISTSDLKVLLPLYGVTDRNKTNELLDLARAARQPGWWNHYKDVASPELLSLIEYESAASAISQFETTFIPGILQTEEYASAILKVFYGEDSAPKRVELRTRRRELLTSEDAPNFSFILDESIIRRHMRDPAASKQLKYLIDVAERPNATIQILPFTTGLHPGMRGPFEVVQFDDAPDESVTFIETIVKDLMVDIPEQTRAYLETFERIREVSLGPSDSLGLMRKAQAEIS